MNNRRGFIGEMLKLCVGATILPSAVTYGRRWVRPMCCYIHLPTDNVTQFLMNHPSLTLVQSQEAMDRFFAECVWQNIPTIGYLGNTPIYPTI